jgi:hypothetical protein
LNPHHPLLASRQMETVPDSSAVRVALWRAMHLQVDPPPHVFEDDVGLKLAAPEAGSSFLPRWGFSRDWKSGENSVEAM